MVLINWIHWTTHSFVDCSGNKLNKVPVWPALIWIKAWSFLLFFFWHQRCYLHKIKIDCKIAPVSTASENPIIQKLWLLLVCIRFGVMRSWRREASICFLSFFAKLKRHLKPRKPAWNQSVGITWKRRRVYLSNVEYIDPDCGPEQYGR